MKAISLAFSTKRECSVQEAIYHVMPELWLRKTFPVVIFANSNLPQHRYRVCRTEEELQEMSEDSTDIFKRNMLDRYIDRPDLKFASGKYKIINNFCYAEFFAHSILVPKKTNDEENDCQPEILQENVLEENNSLCGYPITIPLMSSKEKLKCKKVKSVLRYYVPNCHKYPEKYAHMLFMFFPFRKESDLCSTESGTYMEKLCDPIVKNIVNDNRIKFEPFADLVDTALADFHTDLTRNPDAFAQQENDEVSDMLESDTEDPDENEAPLFEDLGHSPIDLSTLMPDAEIHSKICSLNTKQRQIF